MHKLTLSLRWAMICALIFSIGCGKGGGNSVSISVNSNPKIINGSEIDAASQPQVVRILITSDLGVGLCTGTVISADKILTASHCLESGTLQAIAVESDLIGSIPVAAYAKHPLRAVFPGNYDIAVLQTSVPHGLPAIGMKVSTAVPVQSAVMISGYGKTEDDTVGTLRTGTMIVDGIDPLRLYSIFREELSDTCFGDSGGPAFYTDYTPEGTVAAVGIVGVTEAGTTDNCDVGETSIFTSLNNPDVIQFLQSVAPEAMYY